MHVCSVQLVGINLFPNFRTAVRNLFRSPRACSHLSGLVMFPPTAALQTFASDGRDNDDSGPGGPISSTAATPWSRIRTRSSAITRAGTVAASLGRTFCPWSVIFRNLNSSKESA
ncbi:MAG: DUF2889 domain-containing protein [Candidatus Accumulibacter sp. UW26]